MSILDRVIAIDGHVAQALNGLASVPNSANHVIVFLNSNDFIKMLPFVFTVAWYWNSPGRPERRRIVLAGIVAIFVAFFAGRILQGELPFRARPIHDATLNLLLPHGVASDSLGGWSSFPSDHAAVFGAFVVLIFALSRPLGCLGLLWSVCVVLAPRIYLGEHFLSDVVAGATLGATVAAAALRGPQLRWLAQPFERLLARRPAWFYATAMVFTAELIQMFGDVRQYASVLKCIAIGTY